MEKKLTTYGDLKQRKAELQQEREKGNWLSKPTINRLDDLQDLRQVSQAIKDAELMLLYSITPDESCGELPEQVRQKKCRTRAIVCFVIAGIAAVILVIGLMGCNAIDGFRTDIHQWTDNPAHHQEK